MKASLKSKLSDSQKTVFQFTHTQYKNLVWIDRKEFVWKNVYYDVVQKSHHQGIYTIVCVADKLEKSLLRAMLQDSESSPNDQSSIWGKVSWLFEVCFGLNREVSFVTEAVRGLSKDDWNNQFTARDIDHPPILKVII